MTGPGFGPSFLPELREILLSTGQAAMYGPDGALTEVRDEPFLGRWRLRRLEYEGRGQARAVCVLATAEGRAVTATVDVRDFGDLRSNSSRSGSWNGSAYHDLAVLVSVLIQEQILTRDPDALPDHVRIQIPASRAPDPPAACPPVRDPRGASHRRRP